MAGKAYAALEIDSRKFGVYASHTGGATHPITRQVALSSAPNTMVTEPTGGKEFEPLELTFEDRRDEGFLIDEVYAFFLEWQEEREDKPGAEGGRSIKVTARRDANIVWYSDADFAEVIARHNLVRCWPERVSAIEGERSSPDVRSFTVTLAHRGSTYQKV
ncbi:MAG: hypothetical protein SFU83_18310 [Meiothermus sp.]|nr:hypothetical protein [Meiothermus sp.]